MRNFLSYVVPVLGLAVPLRPAPGRDAASTIVVGQPAPGVTLTVMELPPVVGALQVGDAAPQQAGPGADPAGCHYQLAYAYEFTEAQAAALTEVSPSVSGVVGGPASSDSMGGGVRGFYWSAAQDPAKQTANSRVSYRSGDVTLLTWSLEP